MKQSVLLTDPRLLQQFLLCRNGGLQKQTRTDAERALDMSEPEPSPGPTLFPRHGGSSVIAFFLLVKVILNFFSFACNQNSFPVQTSSGKAPPCISNGVFF